MKLKNYTMEAIKDPVNLPLGDKISAYAGALTRTTHQNSLWVSVDPPNEHFRSEISFKILEHLPGIRTVIGPDGVGTKTGLIDAARGYKNAARDIVAMTAGDITRSGGCPVIFSNVLDVSSLGENDASETFKAAQLLFDGLVEVANALEFNCIKGETAELSSFVSSPNPDAVLKFNWAGFMLGVIHPDKMITGNTLAPGQIIMAFREFGFRSNGMSKVRGIMEQRFGKEWWKQKELIELIATPSTLYDHFLTWLNGWKNKDNNFETILRPHHICHLSGGSFKTKFFEDVLKRKGLAARLDNLWEPPGIVQQCAEWSGMSDEELHEKWSCGQGALVVIDESDVANFMEYAGHFNNVEAKVAGEIVASATPYLEIHSKFSGAKFFYK
jgi:phosphoribosylformylglycinamidine cyclo-ligase